MVVVSYSGKEINAKLVYYGPGLSGKTTNLEFIYDSVPSTHRGKMVSMKTRTERTLFFDFLPIDLGEMAGFKTRFLLYTVPGQVYYNATRKLVLRGVDAVVFVADSGRGKMNENVESLENLRENLREYGMDIDQVPWVIQYNKRDIPDAYTIDELNEALNPGGAIPWYEAVATDGTGVFETFKGISKILLEKLSKEIKTPAGRSTTAPASTAAAGSPAPTAAGSPAPTAAGSPASTAAPAAVSNPATTLSAATGGKATAPAAPVAAAPPTSRPNHSAPGVITKLPEVAPAAAPSTDDADREEKPTLGQRISRFFRKNSGEAMPPAAPAPSASPSLSVPVASPSLSVPSASASPSAPAPAGNSAPPAPAPAAAAKPAAPVAVVAVPPKPAAVAAPHLARVDLPEAEGRIRPAVIEKSVRVPVELTAEEVRDGVTVKLILEVEVTTAAGAEKTGTR